MADSDPESTSASSDSESGSDLAPSPPPRSTQHSYAVPRHDGPPSRFASRQDSLFGGRHTTTEALSTHSDRATSIYPSNHSTASASASAEARRQGLIAIDRKRRLTATGSTHEAARRRYTPTEFLSRTRSQEETHEAGQSVERRQRGNGPSHSLPSIDQTPHAVRTETATQEVIDLTSSSPPLPPAPPPPPPHSPRRGQSSRTSSTSSRRYVVPPWQPDSEVSNCPICRKQFTWIFRRHHCRKCGRVVCDNCSPHRITIPRQFIVNPPRSDTTTSPQLGAVEAIDLTGDDDGNDIFNPQHNARRISLSGIDGGDKVRLCNPCVPDPQPDPLPNFPLMFDDGNLGAFASRLSASRFPNQSSGMMLTNSLVQTHRQSNVSSTTSAACQQCVDTCSLHIFRTPEIPRLIRVSSHVLSGRGDDQPIILIRLICLNWTRDKI
jgi:FYVE zinc finger